MVDRLERPTQRSAIPMLKDFIYPAYANQQTVSSRLADQPSQSIKNQPSIARNPGLAHTETMLHAKNVD